MVRNIKIGSRAGRLLASFSCGAMIIGTGLGASGAAQAKQSVSVPGTYPSGMIIIKQSERQLYFTNGDGTAIRYPVAIGKTGKAGAVRPSSKASSSARTGRRRRPSRTTIRNLPPLIPGGSPNNPMGEAALTLKLDEVAIHGTSNKMRKSVGTAASYGCIRMLNEDVVDLYGRVKVGTPVVSIP